MKSIREKALAVLEQVGPRRRPNANDSIEIESKRWMTEVLQQSDGAVLITEAIIACYQAHYPETFNIQD